MTIFNEQGKLLIFEDFQTDLRLKKYQRKKTRMGDQKGTWLAKGEESASEDSGGYEDDVSDEASNNDFSFSNFRQGSITINSAGHIVVRDVGSKKPKSLWARILDFVAGPPPPELIPELTIEQFFLGVKESTNPIVIVQQRAQGYEEALKNALASGQQALFESLSQNLAAVRAESHLLSLGVCKCLTEEKLVEFVKRSHKGLRLDWIQNFIRVIPPALLKLKVDCDNLLTFDNYVILHYDPKTKSYAETEAEKARRKDPILFGVIKGRRQLYYLGDWVDEFCDLTLDQVADILGKGGVSEIGPVTAT
jgi:hypothetical protein